MSPDVGRLSASAGHRPIPAHEVRALGGLERFRGRRVLEVGTGDGRLVWGYGAAARSVLAIDPDAEAIAAARARLAVLAWTHVRFEVAAAQQWTPPRAVFDLAVMSWAL